MHFWGEIQGNRGMTERGGSKTSGIHGHLRGWNVGAKIYVWHDDEKDKDYVEVYKTSGSHGGKRDELIATFYEGE